MNNSTLKTLTEMEEALDRLKNGDQSDIKFILEVLLKDRIENCKDVLEAF